MNELSPFNNFHPRRFSVLAAALLIGVIGAVNIDAANILYIINSFSDPMTTALANDQEVFDRLVGQGHKVTLADDDTVTTADTNGKDLVLISSSVGSTAPGVNPLCKNVLKTGRIPVVCYEPALGDELLLQIDTNYGNANGHTSLGIVGANKTNPLAAGKSGIIDIVAPGDAAVVSSSGPPPLTLGKEVILIATNATPDIDVGRACIWAYDTGAHLADNTTVTPSRRVQFFFNASTAAGVYNDVAYALFDAAIKWALETAPKTPPKLNPLARQGNNLTISWTGTGKLQQADSIIGPWSDAPVQTSPQTAAIAGAAKFYRIRQ